MTSKHDGRRIRLGMVGGGEGAFIGAVHRIAARLDDRYELVAGALSSDPERSARSAAAWRWFGVTIATASMPSGRAASARAMVVKSA